MCINPAHKQQLLSKYGLPELEIERLEKSGEVRSLSPSEVRSHLGRSDIDSSGLLFRYPNGTTTTIRLDIPIITDSGKPQRYARPLGEPNSLFNPGIDLQALQEIWITEGEAKSLCGHAYGLSVVGLSGIWNWRTEGEEAALLAQGEKLKDQEALLPELAQVDWSGKKINLLYDSDITPGHRAYPAFERLAEQLYRLGAEEVRILSLPSKGQGQKVGLDDFILAKGPEQALLGLQAIKDRKELYLPIRAGGLAYAEKLIKSQNMEDKLKAVVAYLGSQGEASTLLWLRAQIGLQSDVRKALLTEGKKKLRELQVRPQKPSSQAELTQGLGPEYAQIKALLQPHLDEFSLDEFGRIGKIEWKPGIRDGKEVLEPRLIHLCNFAAWPTRDILKDNGITSERFTELEGLLQGSTLRPVKIPSKEFQEMKWVIGAWGTSAAIKPKREQDLRYALQLMAQSGIPETTIFTHLGWRKIKGSWVYLHAGGAVGSDNESIEVELTERFKRYVLPSEVKDKRMALKGSLLCLELGPKKLLYPLYAGVWLAPLCEPLRQAGIEPSHLTYLWGDSGAYKSSLIALLLSHFGDFNKLVLPASFKDTKLSIPEMAFEAKDIILVVDDLYPAQDPKERARLSGTLEHLTRNQGDRQGRGRLKSTSELMVGHPPRGLIYSTGEYMALLGSSLARTEALHIKRGDIDKNKLELAQHPTQKALLAEAMTGYLEWLAPRLDGLSPQFLEDFEYLRKEAAKAATTRNRHGRYDETMAYLQLGLNLFINYVVEQGALTQEEGKKILQEAWESFNQVADDLAQVAEKVEPTKRFFEALLELQTQGRIYFATMEDAIPEDITQIPGWVKIGWGPDEKGIYYLQWGVTWEAVTKYLRAQEESLIVSKNGLLDSFEQQGLLAYKQGNGERRVIVKSIAGKDIRVLPIFEKAFQLEEE